MVIATAQFRSTKPQVRLCAVLNPASGVSEICDGKDLRKCCQVKVSLSAIRRSTIPQKQFIIIFIII